MNMLFGTNRSSAIMVLLFSTQIAGGFAAETSRGNVSAHVTSPQHLGGGTISIQYNVVPQGGNVYRYVYTITNNGTLGGGTPVALFDILFDTSQYQSLQIVTPSSLQSDWSEQILPAVPGLPPAYDSLALHGGIPVGSSVTGFSVQFTWVGPGLPGSQPFQIFDPTTFALLQSGQTQAPVLTVPMASELSLVLLGLGLALTAALQMRGTSTVTVPRR